MIKDSLIVLLLKIGKPILKVIYLLFKLLPTKRKITLISRESNDANIDFRLINKYISTHHNDWQVVILTKTIKHNAFYIFLYFFEILKQMYHIATSRGVILDTYCIPVSILNHKKKLVIVQMWHAMGALKKFGYSIIDKEEGTSKDIAHVFDMHKNYSYVLTSSHFTKPFFAEAFNININKVKVIPLPRVELLRNDEYINIRKRKLEAKYPELRQKKTIVYAPTFRKECKRKHIKITDHIDTEKYNLIVKDHPLSKRLHSDDRTLKFDEDSLDALIVSDYVITDYSAIIFEASILRKPLFFYTYDYEDYLVKRGFYIDYEKEMPGLISPDINEIMKAIENNNYNLERIINFRDRYVDLSSSNFTKDIVSLILR